MEEHKLRVSDNKMQKEYLNLRKRNRKALKITSFTIVRNTATEWKLNCS